MNDKQFNIHIYFCVLRLIHLFEGGILDRMTTAEYEAQSRMISKELNKLKQDNKKDSNELSTNSDSTSNSNESNGKSADNAEIKKAQDSQVIQALNLRMLHGAFIILFVGFIIAGSISECFVNLLLGLFLKTLSTLRS